MADHEMPRDYAAELLGSLERENARLRAILAAVVEAARAEGLRHFADGVERAVAGKPIAAAPPADAGAVTWCAGQPANRGYDPASPVRMTEVL